MRTWLAIALGAILAFDAGATGWKRLTVPPPTFTTTVYDPLRNRILLVPFEK